ncbi:MAG: hypothetical protein AAGA77_18680, partial [Bacteroidota bacterium]
MEKNHDLVVPMKVSALVGNQDLKDNGQFARNPMKYSNLGYFQTPEPNPFNHGRLHNKGIIIQWTLPEGLRHGKPKNDGNLNYPLVPNRWLIQRRCNTNPEHNKLILIKGDEVNNNSAITNASFLDHNKESISYIHIGASQTTWAANDIYDPNHHQFLTAIGPANPNFSFVQYNNEKVFSYSDTSVSELTSQDLLFDYQVVGWYVNSTEDLFSACTTLEETQQRLNELFWSVSRQLGIRYVFLNGQIKNVPWKSTSLPSHKPEPANVKIAIGATIEDAQGALSSHLTEKERSAFEAFELGILSWQDEEYLGGAFEIEHNMKERRFLPSVCEYYWVVAEGIANSTQQAQIQKLNAYQQELDNLQRQITSTKNELYRVWWKIQYGRANEIPSYHNHRTLYNN